MWLFFLVTVAIIVSGMASGILVLYFRVYQTDELRLMLKKDKRCVDKISSTWLLEESVHVRLEAFLVKFLFKITFSS